MVNLQEIASDARDELSSIIAHGAPPGAILLIEGAMPGSYLDRILVNASINGTDPDGERRSLAYRIGASSFIIPKATAYASLIGWIAYELLA